MIRSWSFRTSSKYFRSSSGTDSGTGRRIVQRGGAGRGGWVSDCERWGWCGRGCCFEQVGAATEQQGDVVGGCSGRNRDRCWCCAGVYGEQQRGDCDTGFRQPLRQAHRERRSAGLHPGLAVSSSITPPPLSLHISCVV